MNLALLVFAGVAPWLASLRDTSARGSLKSGFLFGFLFFLFQMYWLVPFVERWTGRLGTALVPWLVSALLAGIVYAPLGWLIRECWRRGWVWLIPLVWAGHEGFRAYMPVLAFPWAILVSSSTRRLGRSFSFRLGPCYQTWPWRCSCGRNWPKASRDNPLRG
jgi:apolipoprotein N-acyltransferase